MGNTSTTDAPSSLAPIFWQDRPRVYAMEETNHGKIFIEEVKTPWDLYIEGVIFDSQIGDTHHQNLVANKMVRIFSLRNEEGNPMCNVLTKPEKAPDLDLYYGARRVFNTSAPMTIDGEPLVVLDVLGKHGIRVKQPLLGLAKAFFLGNGGRLNGEHPNGLIYNTKRDIKRWRSIAEADTLADIVISESPLRGISSKLRSNTFYARSAAVAKSLLDERYWDYCHINGCDPWVADVVAHMEADPEAVPNHITVWNDPKSENNHLAPIIYARVQSIYDNKNKRKS